MAIGLLPPLSFLISGLRIDAEYRVRNIRGGFFGSWEARVVVCGVCFVEIGCDGRMIGAAGERIARCRAIAGGFVAAMTGFIHTMGTFNSAGPTCSRN